MQEADAGGARSLPGPHSRPLRAGVTAQRLRHCRGVGHTVGRSTRLLTAHQAHGSLRYVDWVQQHWTDFFPLNLGLAVVLLQKF